MFFKTKVSAARVAPAAKAPLVPDGELDLRALGRPLWLRKRAIIVPTLIVASLSLINLLTPQYSSAARILYEARENIFSRLEAETSNLDRSAADVKAWETSQVQLVLSCDLALLHTPFALLRTEDAD